MPYKDKEIRARKQRERYQNDAEYRERMKNSNRAARKERYHALYSTDPIFRDRELTNARRFYARRKAEDPEYRRDYGRDFMRRSRAAKRNAEA